MLGVCYYPEHWRREKWITDAQQMHALGIQYVRIGEFAWSKLEPEQDKFEFTWFDEIIHILHNQGLKVVIGTPTATPPKWLVDKYPEILPVDPYTGMTRGFGSRRHYDFSSTVYRREAVRITTRLAQRYGKHKGVVGWQTDNELCCHDTTLSGSDTAKIAFREWCRQKYTTIAELNKAWGNVFWSMDYQNFDAIELPMLTVTEANPAHVMAYREFSSDQVIIYHNALIEAIRTHSVNQFITHNFIWMDKTGVDNFTLAKDLDFTSYDNYPLGLADLTLAHLAADEFSTFMRTGHPDLSAFYFDQTRGLSASEQFWVMEQQPGPVNWAKHNPSPAPGMVALWSVEAFAHGAECVSYFRWRQVPFAQEQMHAGLLRVDDSKTPAWEEVETVQKVLHALQLNNDDHVQASVAMVMDHQAQWVTEIERQGDSYRYVDVIFDWYSAVRQLGLTVDFISVNHDLSNYELVLVPCLPIIEQAFIDACQKTTATVIFGPRTGGKTEHFSLPLNLQPGLLQQLLPIKIVSIETIRPDCAESLIWQKKTYTSFRWRESIEPTSDSLQQLAKFSSNEPAIVQQDNIIYVATLSSQVFYRMFFKTLSLKRGLPIVELSQALRLQQRGKYTFIFNYGDEVEMAPAAKEAQFIHGARELAPHSFAIFIQPPQTS